VPVIAALGQDTWRVGAQLVEVAVGQLAAAAAERIESCELRQTDASRHIRQVVLAAGLQHVDSALGITLDAVETLAFDAANLIGIVEHDGAALDGGHVLVRMKAEAGNVAERSDATAAPDRSDRVRSVLDDAQTVRSCDVLQAVHVNRQAGEMHRHDGAGSRREGFFDAADVEISADELHIDEHRPGADTQYDIGARREAHCRHDHFVRLANARGQERELEGCRAGGERADRAATQIGGKRTFKSVDVGPGRNPSRAQDFADAGDGFLIDAGARKRQIHGHARL
jgi:hypothetical protein